MLKAGISTACLYPQPIEEALYDLALGGVTMVELFINTHSELKRSFVAALSAVFRIQTAFAGLSRILPLLFYRYAAAGSKYFCSTWQ